jgi:cell division protein FtsW
MTFDRWGDGAMLTITLVLLGIGATAVFSASSVMAISEGGSAYTYLIRHCVKIAAGLIFMTVAWAVPFTRWGRLSPLLAIAALGALIAVLVPSPFRVTVNGVHRWLRVGPVLFQPSEMARVTLVMYMAWVLSRKGDRLKSLTHGYLPPLMAVGVFAALVAAEPSLGCAIALFMVGFVLLFAAGARLAHLAGTVGLAALGAAAFVKPYQWKRILTFVSSDVNPLDSGWQLWQSLVALGSGGIAGKWGGSLQKFHYLPYPHTDFIFSVLGEQWGLIGALVVLGLVAALIWRGVRVAMAAGDPFASLLAIGLTASIGVYALLNVAVATGLAPTTGLPFPFLSYGGSALVANLFSVGVLLNISRFNTVSSVEKRYSARRAKRRSEA